MTHLYLPGLPSAAPLYASGVKETGHEVGDQIVATWRLIELAVHEPMLLFRPPYDSHTPAADAEIRRLLMAETLWMSTVRIHPGPTI